MYVYRRKAHYHETDKMGVIYHANYIRWMEEARVEFLDSIDLNYRALEERGVISPVTGISIDYKRPVEFDDEVEVRVSTESFDGVLLQVSYEIFDLTKGCLSARASSKHCFLMGGRITNLKKTMPDAYEKIKGSEEGPKGEE